MEYKTQHIDPFIKFDHNHWVKLEHLGRYIFAKDIISDYFGRNGSKVLDLGCGNGYGTSILAEVTSRCLAVDINNEALQEGKKQYQSSEISYRNIDLNKPGNNIAKIWGEKNFEVVVSFEVLEHLVDPKRIVREIYNLIGEQGYFIVSVPNEKFESLDSNGNPKNPFHIQAFNLDRLKELMQENGFQIQNYYGQAQTHSNLIQNKENKLVDKDLLTRKEKLDIAREYAYPCQDDIDSSYSIIAIAKKI